MSRLPFSDAVLEFLSQLTYAATPQMIRDAVEDSPSAMRFGTPTPSAAAAGLLSSQSSQPRTVVSKRSRPAVGLSLPSLGNGGQSAVAGSVSDAESGEEDNDDDDDALGHSGGTDTLTLQTNAGDDGALSELLSAPLGGAGARNSTAAAATAPLLAICEFYEVPLVEGEDNVDAAEVATTAAGSTSPTATGGTAGAAKSVTEGGEEAYAKAHSNFVVASTDPAVLLKQMEADNGPQNRGRGSMEGAAVHTVTKPLSIILITQRTPPSAGTTATAAGRGGAPAKVLLNVRDLHIQSLDLEQPLATLQGLLKQVYDPLLATKKIHANLHTQVQDLMSGLRSAGSTLPQVDIRRFVDEELLTLCDENPGEDVPQLIEQLGEQSKDTAYVRRVLQVRNRCLTVLPIDALLSGKKMEEAKRAALGATTPAPPPSGQSKGSSASTSSATAGVIDLEGMDISEAESVWVVQEHIAYWRSVQIWMETTLRQLQGREWRLVHKLLGHRVETSYVKEFVTGIQQVREYIKFLEQIPEKQVLRCRKEDTLLSTARLEVDAVMRASAYPPRLLIALLNGILSKIASRWVQMREEDEIVLPLPDAPREDGEKVVRSLQDSSWLLRKLQRLYVTNNGTLREMAKLFAPAGTDGLKHVGLAALQTRCVALRNWVEEYCLLLAQLRDAFMLNTHAGDQEEEEEGPVAPTGVTATVRPGQAIGRGGVFHSRSPTKVHSQSGSDIDPAMKSSEEDEHDNEEGNGPVASLNLLHGHDEDAGKTFIVDLQAAYEECLDKLLFGDGPGLNGTIAAGGGAAGGFAGTLRTMNQLEAENIMWSTRPAALRRFNAALARFHERVDRCDGNVANYLSHMLSTTAMEGQSGGGAAASAVIGGAPAHFGAMTAAVQSGPLQQTQRMTADNRLFRIFAHFRFLRLAKVQRVVENYRTPVSDKIAATVQELKEWYYNVSAARRQTLFGMQRFHLSSLITEVLWERNVLGALQICGMCRDYVAERGWHHLLSLRGIEHLWRLDERLAAYIGYPLADLASGSLAMYSEVHGTALALVYLKEVFVEDEYGWSIDAHLRYAETYVQRKEPQAMQMAKDRLALVGAFQNFRADRAQQREIRSVQETIGKHLEEKLQQWTMEVEEWVRACPRDAQSAVLKGPILRVADTGVLAPEEANVGIFSGRPKGSTSQSNSIQPTNMASSPTATAIGAGAAFLSPSRRATSLITPQKRAATASPVRPTTSTSVAGGGPGSLTGVPTFDAPHLLVAEVTFPFKVFQVAEDLRFLESIGVARGNAIPHATFVTIQHGLKTAHEFVRHNEHRGRLAQVLADVLRVFYATVNGEDNVLLLLATEEYEAVNECILRGFSLTWSDDLGLLQYVQEMSEKMQVFSEVVQQLRSKVDTVYAKINSFHLRAFHPEAIGQRVREVRRLVDSLSIHCVHAHLWIRCTQPLLDKALAEQVRFLMHGWARDFEAMRDDIRYLSKSAETDVFHLKPLRVRMCVVYKEVKLDSPAAFWRHHWLSELSKNFGWVDTLPHLYDESDTRVEAVSPQGEILMEVMGNAAEERGTGYPYVLSHLPSYVLAEPLQAIEQCVADAVLVEERWRRSQQFLSLDVTVMQQRFGNDLKRWSQALSLLHSVTAQLMDYTQPNTLLGGIVILAEEAQIELGRKLDQVSLYSNNKFKDVLEKELDRLFHKIGDARKKAEALDVISNMEDAATFLSQVPRLQTELKEDGELLEVMVASENELRKLGYLLPESWIPATMVQEEFISFKELIERKMKAVQLRAPAMLESATGAEEALNRKINELDQRVQKLDQRVDSQAAQSILGVITSCDDEAQGLLEEAKKLVSIQEALGLPLFNTATIDKVAADTRALKEAWDYGANAYTTLHTLGEIPFFEMVPRRLHEELLDVQQSLDGFPEALQHFTIYNDLCDRVQKLVGYRRFMQDLRSDAMSPLDRARAHWVALKNGLDAPWVLERLTVQDVWDTDPTTNAAVYNEVIEMAQGERRIEVQLQQITSFWETFLFSLVAYKNQVCLFRGWDAVFEKLNDDLSTFSGIRASPYFLAQPLISMTNDTETRLTRLRQILEVLLDVQKRWVYLDTIFNGNDDIRTQLPMETQQFSRTTRELIHLLPHPRAGGQLPDVRAAFFLDDEKMLPTLERLATQLNATQRALAAYLDTQRGRFPRFYFVGDDDLLEILGNSKSPVFFNKHLKKMFTALSAFTVDQEQGTITGFGCSEGEEVRYTSPIVYKDRTLYDWIQDAEKGMSTTLCRRTVLAFRDLQNKDVTLDWLGKYPVQALCLAMQMYWALLQEKLFTSDEPAPATTVDGGGRRNPRGPSSSAVTEKMDALLELLAVSVLDASIPVAIRHCCEQLINIAVYQRDISRVLAATHVVSAKDFSWQRVLRVYGNAAGTQVECRMADATCIHGFEYTGRYERLVQTPLTDKAYLTLMQALHTRLGGSPIGPAGTGKTETVKALGMQLGRHVLVFNCDDAFDYQAVSRIFLGLCQVGAWGCFDEFNRLEERIMSALSQQIKTIQAALRARASTVDLNNRADIPLNDKLGLFITMNPGYAGRSKLPGNLKQLFRTVTMTVPDRETIAEVMLFAQGFHTAEQLSLKVVPLFRLCEDQFTKQAHYDFGLRALKSVLVAAGVYKREQGHAQRNERTEAESASALEERECQLMLQSIISNVAPKLITQDVSLFFPLLHDFFPGKELPMMPLQTLHEAIKTVCEETGLCATSTWVEKVLQTYHTKSTRHGIMLAGPSGTGKTTAWKVLMSAMVRVDRQLEMRAYVIEPKVLSKAELFGTLDVTTREWKDGVFTSILRMIIDQEELAHDDAAEKQQDRADGRAAAVSVQGASEAGGEAGTTQREHWIVFDGDVDPEWVENLNSVLDDNKILTLPNGERLNLPRSVRIFFEVQDLNYATPATVSRCGMVWFSEGVVPLPSVLSYAHTRMSNVSIVDNRGRRTHWSLEEDIIGAANSTNYMQQQQQQLLQSGGAGGSDAVITGHRGKTYHEYILANASEAMENMLGATRRGGGGLDGQEFSMSGGSPGSPSDRQDSSSHNRSPRNGEGDFLGETYRGGGGGFAATMRRRGFNEDVQRIQDGMVRAWSPAFRAGGLIARGIRLVGSDAYRGKCIMEFSALQLVHSVVALLLTGVWHAYEAEQQSGDILSETLLITIADKTLQFAVFWALSAPLPYEQRLSLANALGLTPSVQGNPQSIMDVEVDYTTGEWRCIRERVKQTEIAPAQVGANDTVIPTVDTCRHEELLTAWIASGNSAILCGPPGSGKTMSITAVLNNSPEYEAVFLNFSSGTSVETMMKSLEQYCTVEPAARGLVMTPRRGRRLLLFCDEVNLPAKDVYGTQTVIQFLRQLVERNGFYRTRDNAWVSTENIQVVAACNPPTDPGRVPLSPRFLRWAPVLYVDFPTPDSLEIIYTTYCRAVLAFNRELQQGYATRLAKAMCAMYHASQKRFTPIQQPHYLYSPRELSRWSRAILEAIMTYDEHTRAQLPVAALVRLGVHEGLRVFSDRLVSADEQSWTDTVIDKCFKEQFPEVDPTTTYQRPILYSTLLSRAYTDSPREALRALIEKKLKVFAEEEMANPLVVFDAMIDHVVRIDRVLRQPLGHVLISGASGVGKTSVARLVAWMGGFSSFWLKVHRDYGIEDFEEDLRDLLRRSGCQRERICFLFDESNIMQPAFLEYMNALLASGEVPGLFEGEEWPKLMQAIREAITTTVSNSNGPAGKKKGVTSAGQPPRPRSGSVDGLGSPLEPSLSGAYTTQEDPLTATHMSRRHSADLVDTNNEQLLYAWFLDNVKHYLHVVFTVNPSSTEFSSRAVTSPALFNRCTIDWFGDWSLETMSQITMARTKDIDFDGACGDVFASSEDAQLAVVDALCSMHQVTSEINAAVRTRNGNQGTFITPRHFTASVNNFVDLITEKRGGSTEQLVHLRAGLLKLNEVAKEVKDQQATLQESEKAIADRTVKAQAMLNQIVKETDVAKTERDVAEKLRAQLQIEEEKISADTKRVQDELAEAEPALKDAEAALGTVKPEYLREIRTYTTPPPLVKKVLEAVCVLMGQKNSDDWDTLKSMLRKDDFLSNVKAFRPDDVTDASRDRVGVLLKDKKLTVEAAYRASKAAGPLFQWVVAQVNFSAIFKRVAPIRAKIDELVKVRDSKLSQVNAAEKEIWDKESSLRRLKEDYEKSTREVAELKARIATVTAKCERAKTIVVQLKDERGRWEEEIKALDAQTRTTLGDCVLAAAFMAYIGFYDEYTRQQVLLPRWTECVQVTSIPTSAELNTIEFLAHPKDRLEWEQSGLPKDRLCVENAAIMQRCDRYTLLMDPEGTAVQYLQKLFAQKKIRKASFSRKGYLKELEMAVRFGYPIILEDAEFLDPAVAPLLNRDFHYNGSRRITRIGPNDVDMAPTFQLFLLTRDPNYQPTPGMAGQICLVNFTVTLSSLQSQCLHQVLLHERPDTDVRRTELLETQSQFQLRLRVLQQNLLTTIAQSEGSLLDDDALVNSLTALKEDAMKIQTSLSESESSMEIVHRVESRYRPVATAAAKVFFALKRLSELSVFYRFNVRFIFRVLQDALDSLPDKSNVAATTAAEHGDEDDVMTATELERLEWITSCLFAMVYRRAARGMFREDHLALALRLAQLRGSMDPLDATKTHVQSPKSLAVAEIKEAEWDWLLESIRATNTSASADANDFDDAAGDDLPPVVQLPGLVGEVGRHGRASLARLLSKPAFKEVRRSLVTSTSNAAWKNFFLAERPLDYFMDLPRDAFPPGGTSDLRKLFLLTLVLYYVRRDTFVETAFKLLHMYFDGETLGGNGDLSVEASLVSLPTISSVSNANLGQFFATSTQDLFDAYQEMTNATPLLMISDASYDPSTRVEELAVQMDVKLQTVALGSAESAAAADELLEDTFRTGGWVLLKNAHLARAYMDTLEKRLHYESLGGKLKPDFRLFLTADRAAADDEEEARRYGGAGGDESLAGAGGSAVNGGRADPSGGAAGGASSANGGATSSSAPSGPGDAASSSANAISVLPINLMESSVTVVYEAPPGIKSSLLQTFGGLESENEKTTKGVSASPPVASMRQRLILAAAWVHAVVMERLFYVPVGWTQQYEYSDTEFSRVLQALVSWTTAEPPSADPNVPAEPTVLWVALREIIATTIYGGKVSNAFDERILTTFCKRVLSSDVFKRDFRFISASPNMPRVPMALRGLRCSRKDILRWIGELPDGYTNPQWLGLPSSVARMMLSRRAVDCVERLAAVQLVLKEELVSSAPGSLPRRGASAKRGGLTREASVPSAQSLSTARWVAKMKDYTEAWLTPLAALRDEFIGNAFIQQAVEQSASTHTQQLFGGETGEEEQEESATVPNPRAPRPSVSAASVDPLTLAMQREVVAATELLRRLVTDVSELSDIAKETRNPSSRHRMLILTIMKDRVPSDWAAHLAGAQGTSAATMLVSAWVVDVQLRLRHLLQLARATAVGKLAESPVSVGLLFSPGAFLTASKQQCARDRQVSLERLAPKVTVVTAATDRAGSRRQSQASATTSIAKGGILLDGATLYCARVGTNGRCALIHAESAVTTLTTPVALQWQWVEVGGGAGTTTQSIKGAEHKMQETLEMRLDRQDASAGTIALPFYVTRNREAMLDVLDIEIEPSSDPDEVDVWYQRGVCLVAWAPE